MSKPLDTCKCGDYRRDHTNSVGACSMANDLTHGFKPCKEFRLSVPEDEKLNFTNQARIILRALIHVYTKPEEDLLAVIEGRAKNSEIAPLDETGEIALKELIKLNGDK